jgi:hypothetical protein
MAAPEIPGLEGVAVVNGPVGRDHAEIRVVERPWRWWFGKIRRLTLRKLMGANRRALYRRIIRAKASSLMGKPSRYTGFSTSVKFLLDRRVPILFMYGRDDFRKDFELELDRGLRSAIELAGPATRIVMVPDRLEGCASLGSQEVLLETVLTWLRDLPEMLQNEQKLLK